MKLAESMKRKLTASKTLRAWIDGSTNHKTSNIVDHASSDQHKMAMMQLREERTKSSGEPITSHSD